MLFISVHLWKPSVCALAHSCGLDAVQVFKQIKSPVFIFLAKSVKKLGKKFVIEGLSNFLKWKK